MKIKLILRAILTIDEELKRDKQTRSDALRKGRKISVKRESGGSS